MKITDATTTTDPNHSIVCRTYLTSDRLARLRVTRDRRIWLDGGSDRCALAGTLPDGEPITRAAARKAANQ